MPSERHRGDDDQGPDIAPQSSPSLHPLPFGVGDLVAGKYRIERLIGRGGLGVVVAATHLQLGQTVAIKFLKVGSLEKPLVVERFALEARLASGIRSEHVVRVFDVGTLESGAPYIVMEYLEGEDLGQVVAGGPVSPAEAVDLILQACDALAEAHGAGVVHRDLKPENLFLARRPGGARVLKVLDFGISKDGSGASSGAARKLTTTTARFGTPAYMSPEQIEGSGDVDARSDIWSLGVILHELVTGQLPFAGGTLQALLFNILSQPPVRVTQVRRDAPLGLERAVLKCLEKDRAVRFRNVAEFVQALEPFAGAGGRSRIDQIERIVSASGQSVKPQRVLPAGPHGPMRRGVHTTASLSFGGTVSAPRTAGRRFAALAVAAATVALAGLFVRQVRHNEHAAAGTPAAIATIAENRPISTAATQALARPPPDVDVAPPPPSAAASSERPSALRSPLNTRRPPGATEKGRAAAPSSALVPTAPPARVQSADANTFKRMEFGGRK